MRAIHGQVFALFCLTITLISFCSISSSVPIVIRQNGNSNIVEYELRSAFVGNLTHTIQIYNPTSDKVSDGQLFVPLIKNETARHYVICNIYSYWGEPTIIQDDSGSIYACWKNITIGENQTFTVEIYYQILSFSNAVLS